MISVPQAFRHRLASDQTIAAACSDASGRRVYVGKAVQAAPRPYVVVRQTGGQHDHNMAGASGLVHPTIQVDIIGSTDTQCASLKEAARRCLQGFRGPVQIDGETCHIRRSHLEQDGDPIIEPQSGSDDAIYVASLVFAACAAEPIPTSY